MGGCCVIVELCIVCLCGGCDCMCCIEDFEVWIVVVDVV